MFLTEVGGFVIIVFSIFAFIASGYSNYSLQLDSVRTMMKKRNKENTFDPRIVSINSTIDERLKIWYDTLS